MRKQLAAIAFVVGLVLSLAPLDVRAEEESTTTPEPDDPVLEGEAKRAHAKEVKALLKWLHGEKNREVVELRIKELGGRKTRAARDALIAFVPGNKNHEYATHAFYALGEIGGKTARTFLVGKHALRSRNFLVAHSAAEALGRTRDERAAPDLLAVMTHKRTKIKVVGACAIALGKCGGDHAPSVEALFKYSHHRKDTIRAYAVEALGYLGTDEAIERLTEALQEDDNARVRAAAATGLGWTRRSETIPVLEAALAEDNSHHVRDAVLAAIKVIRDGP